MTNPFFLTVEEVFVLHKNQIEEFGGIHGIRDEGLLESAVMTPQLVSAANIFIPIFLKWQLHMPSI